MLTAHYFGSKAKGFHLIIANGPSPSFDYRVATISVKGKVEARKVAASYNAKPWNF
jgi:hypothetical protein